MCVSAGLFPGNPSASEDGVGWTGAREPGLDLHHGPPRMTALWSGVMCTYCMDGRG